MEIAVLENIRNGMVEKQQGLLNWLGKFPQSKKAIQLGPSSEDAVESLLCTIEECIERAGTGSLGVCEVCQEYVETNLLEVDYTACICLEHYSPEEMKRLESELELAQIVQKTLLPQEVPNFPGMKIAAFSRPAQIVGGDYFDFFRLSNGDYAFAIADVAGHGVSAGLHMASIQAMLRSIVPTCDSPAEIMKRLHQLFIHNIRFTTFVSIFLAAFNPSGKTLTYVNAGHNPPIHLRNFDDEGDQIQWLHPTGAAVGLIEEAVFEEITINLDFGDSVVMYTDGVIEAVNHRYEQFGEDRLITVLKALNGHAPVDVIRGIRLELDRFTRGYPYEDDTTVIAVKIQPMTNHVNPQLS